MAEQSMDEILNKLNSEKQKEDAANAQTIVTSETLKVDAENKDEGTSVNVESEKTVSDDKADAERPKPVPKKNRRGSKALQAEVEKYKLLADENQVKYTQLLADFDNVRARYEKESKKKADEGSMDTIKKLLPVIDNFERAIANIPEGEKNNFSQGVEMIYKQLMEELGKIGVTPMNAVGKEFDPTYHNAVMHVEDSQYGENIIIEEMQKGYMYKDSVLRHSYVKVAN